MINWIKIANDIIRAEFPSYGVMSHLSQCTLLDKSKFKKMKGGSQLPSAIAASLKTLSQAWGIDLESRLPKLNG